MLFRRRQKLSRWDRLKLMLWPQRSFSRSIQYFSKRVLRLTATPHAIAAGVAAGAFASFTPLIGFHFILAFAIAYVIAGNMVAAGIGTAIGNPLTFPFIWTATYKLGHKMLDGPHGLHGREIDLERLLRQLEVTQLWEPVLKPMLLGSLPIGLPTALVFYGLTYWSVSAFQERRRRILAARSAQRAGATNAAESKA